MTTAANVRRNDIVAAAAQTAFSYTFEIANQTDLVVQQNGTTLTITTEYTVSGVGDENGGTVTLVTGAAEDDAIAMFSDEAIERLSDYLTAGDFRALVINAELDKIYRLLGDNNAGVSRTLRLSDSDPQAGVFELPVQSLRLGKLLRFNAVTGLPEAVDVADISGLVIGAGVVTFFQAATVLAAQQAIDLEPGVDVQAFDANTMFSDTTAALTVGFTNQILDLGTLGDTDSVDLDIATRAQVKFTAEGSGNITVNAPTDTHGGYVEALITISTTGGTPTLLFTGFEKTISGAMDYTDGAINLLTIRRIGAVDIYDISQVVAP